MRNLFYLLGSLVLALGCVEDYELELSDAEARIVVEALITNEPGPYYVRLIYSRVGEFKPVDYHSIDDEKPVLNASIIISDDHEQVDTLIPINLDLEGYIYEAGYGYIKLIYDNAGQVVDTVFLEDPEMFTHDRGYYKTTSLVGIPNRMYKLHIIADGADYYAQDYMMEVPEIDSLTYEKRNSGYSNPQGPEYYYVPLLNFKEPQNEKNYYLIQFGNELQNRMYSTNRLWRFSILSDKYLEPYVNRLIVDDGASPDGIEFYRSLTYGHPIEVSISSLSPISYDYYDNLLKQFENDGGVYKPSPASPPTNITNGGLGFFRASATTNIFGIIGFK